MIFTPDTLPINYFDSIEFVGIIFKIAVVDRAVLSPTEFLGRQHDFDLITREGNNFTSWLQWLLFLTSVSICRSCVSSITHNYLSDAYLRKVQFLFFI